MVSVIGPFPPLARSVRAQSLAQTMAGHLGDVWIFGYGSLMWDSTLPVVERTPATLHGYRRSFCIWTAHARGTPEQPGLALGLLPDDAARCEGLALKLDEAHLDTALAQLWDREMWTDVYCPVWQKLVTPHGSLNAIAFEVNQESQQFSDELSLQETAQNIAKAVGVFGTCRDYLFDTVHALERGGVDREEFRVLCETVERFRAAC